MGSHYRERRGNTQSTVSDDVSGLTGNVVESSASVSGGTQADYSGYNLKELQELADARGLKSYGTKADIAARLTEDDNA